MVHLRGGEEVDICHAKRNGPIRKRCGHHQKKTVTKEYTYWEARCIVGYDPGTGRQVQRSITGKTQKEVAQKLKRMTVEVDQGSYQAPCKLTVKDWLEIWTAEYLGDVKEATAYLYRKNADQYIVPSLCAVKLEALTAPMVQALYNDLLKPQKEDVKPLSAKTIKNVHGVFHEALQQAVQVGYLRTNPTDACKPPRVAKPEIHPLDEAKMTDFLAALPDHPHEHPYQITLFTGLREVEVLRLTWNCLDFEHGTLLVKQQLRREQKKRGKYYFSPPKNNKSRVLALAPSVIRLFRWQKLKQGGMRLKAGDDWTENNLVFTNQAGGLSLLPYCLRLLQTGHGENRFTDHPFPRLTAHLRCYGNQERR